MHCEIDLNDTIPAASSDAGGIVASDEQAGVSSPSSSTSRLSSTDVFLVSMGVCAAGIIAMVVIQKYRAGNRRKKASTILNAFQDSVDEHARSNAAVVGNKEAYAADEDGGFMLDNEDVLSGDDSFSRRGLRRDLESDISSGSKSSVNATAPAGKSKSSFYSGFS